MAGVPGMTGLVFRGGSGHRGTKSTGEALVLWASRWQPLDIANVCVCGGGVRQSSAVISCVVSCFFFMVV